MLQLYIKLLFEAKSFAIILFFTEMIFNYTQNEKYEPLVLLYSMSLLFSFSTSSVNQTISRNEGMQYSIVSKTKGLHIISHYLILYLLDNMYYV